MNETLRNIFVVFAVLVIAASASSGLVLSKLADVKAVSSTIASGGEKKRDD